jgi:general secretion pathway protein A
MDYFALLELDKEPFSNSPDPAFFYESAHHVTCLQQLELAIHLRRGLNVVMGRVGTGKTTLSRELVRRLDGQSDVRVHLILDPSFASVEEFLVAIEEMVLGESLPGLSVWQRKERIKKRLFTAGVEESILSVLLIDEGQKLSLDCLEIVREFLNYETNTGKLLQVIIFAQEEFGQTLRQMENFQDRINLLYHLGPMSFGEMRAMIRFRLRQSAQPGVKRLPFFTLPALWLTYRMTRGYPRKVIHICHRVLLTLIIQGKTRITWNMVRVAGRSIGDGPSDPGTTRPFWKVALALGVLIMAGIWVGHGQGVLPVEDLTRFWRVADVPASQAVAAREASQNKTTGNDTATDVAHAEPFTSEPGPVRHQVHGDGGNEEAVSAVNVPPSPFLGVIRARSGDVMYRFIRGIYTPSSLADLQDRLQVVVGSNPGLQNRPGRLLVGTHVVFPTPDPVHDPFGRGQYWLMLANGGELEPMYRLYEEYRKKTRMVVHWNRENGFSFSLMYDQGFATQEEARQAVERPQPGLYQEPVVIDRSTWAHDVFFTRLPAPDAGAGETVRFSTRPDTARHIETARIPG